MVRDWPDEVHVVGVKLARSVMVTCSMDNDYKDTHSRPHKKHSDAYRSEMVRSIGRFYTYYSLELYVS